VNYGKHPVRTAGILAVVTLVAVAGVFVAFKLEHPPKSAGGLTVLATFYPVFDFARNIAGDRANVTLLVPMTTDVHAFNPTPDSVAAVAQAKVLIFSGAGLEPWIPSIVSASGNLGLIQVDSSAGVPTIPVPPKWQAEGRTTDPHIWLDPVLARQQVANIVAGLIQADPHDQAYFEANARTYDAKLATLDAEARNLSAHPATREFVTFHTAFGYFARQYNLTQVPVLGPFEDTPNPTDIQNVTNVVNSLGLCYVGYESLENPAIPEAIANMTHATLIHMDPIEGLSTQDQTVGKTYLTKMQEDLDNISLALDHVGCH
jgi:zinc transport system substrate-binding protein